MDTQGLFDHESSPTDNARIFSLSTLISSAQILNLFSNIQEDNLEYLQFATEYARFAGIEDNGEDGKPFQNLMFVIRDWSSPDDYEYGLDGGNRFLKSFLRIKDFHTPELKSIRQYMEASFDKLNCFLMPYPGKIVARNSTYDGSWSDIDEEFVDAMKELFPVLLAPANLTLKTVNNKLVKAYELSVYIKLYIDLYKSENLPTANSIYDSTLDNQFQILNSKCVEIYINSVEANQEALENVKQIDELHESSKFKAFEFFINEKKFGSSEDGERFKEELDEKLTKAFEQWKPIALENVQKLQIEREQIRKQEELKKIAEENEAIARRTVKKVEKNIETAKQEILQTEQKVNNDETRRETEMLKRKLADAENDRRMAITREKDTRLYLEEIRRQTDLLRQEIIQLKVHTQKQMKKQITVIHQQIGIGQWFNNKI
ncbi:unnamed protein product, partial [Diamesa serratosioi]